MEYGIHDTKLYAINVKNYDRLKIHIIGHVVVQDTTIKYFVQKSNPSKTKYMHSLIFYLFFLQKHKFKIKDRSTRITGIGVEDAFWEN